MLTWPDAIGLSAIAVIFTGIVALVRGPEFLSWWLQHAYEHDNDTRPQQPPVTIPPRDAG